MWFFLSRRLRTWFILAVGLPLLRALLGRAATYTGRKHPDAPATSALRRLDGLLASMQSRTRRGRRRAR